MALTLSLTRVLGHKDFFPEQEPESKAALAHLIGKKFAFEFCCHFLGNFKLRHIPPIDILMQEWFTFYEYKFFQSPIYFDIRDRLDRILRGDPGSNLQMLVVESFLIMISWLTTDPGIPEDVEINASHPLPLLKLCLLFNDDLLARYEIGHQSIPGIPVDRRPTQLAMAMGFPQNDMVNPDYAQTLNTQFYKGARLLEFMAATPKYKPIVDMLLADFRCTSIIQYFNYVGKTILLGVQSLKNGWTIINVPPHEEHDQVCFILDKISIVDEPVPDLQDDYLDLRSRPLRKIADGKYMVIYDMFLIKKLYNGLIFYLSRMGERIPSIRKNFLSQVRQDFSEGELVYDTFRYIYQKSPSTVLIPGQEFRDKGFTNSEPDFYVRDLKDILLIESKDFYMKGKIKLSYEFLDIEAALTVDKDGNPDRLGKAALQLITNIERIITKTLTGDTEYDLSEITIYPVIVVHDAIYSSPGLNHWFHFKMIDLLEELKSDPLYARFDFNQIKPLTLMEIDTLIFFEESFHQKKIHLAQLLSEYHAWVDYARLNVKTTEDVYQHGYQSNLPFAEFLRSRAKEENLRLETGRFNDILVRFGFVK